MGNIRDEASLPAEVFRNIFPADYSKNKFECFVIKNINCFLLASIKGNFYLPNLV